MRIALAGLALASGIAATLVTVVTVAAEPSPRAGPPGDRNRSARIASKGLSLEEIRGVMRSNAGAFNACLTAAARHNKQLHGPFLYQIEVDKKGIVTSAHPYQPSAVASFDKCVTAVIKRARFPGGPASVEAPLVFDPG